MALHGAMGAFDTNEEDWVVYTERLQNYFVANDVTSDDKKRAILLSVCGASTYRLIRNLVSPNQPSSKSYADLVQLVKEHFHPKPSAIVMRFQFNSCFQREGEKLPQFVARLRQLTEYCEFGTTLDEMLRDRLVCGLRDERVQKRLLSEVTLTFDKALKLAQASETAELNTRVLRQVPEAPVEVHTTDKKATETRGRGPKTTNGIPCFRCGDNHSPAQCQFRRVDCHHCGKRGHLARVCRSRAKPSSDSKRRQFRRRPMPEDGAKTHCVTDAEAPSELEAEEPADYVVFQVSREKVAPLMTSVQIDNKPLKMQVDTGAAMSLVSEATYRRLWPNKSTAPVLRGTSVRLRTYSGEELRVLGTVRAIVMYEKRPYDVSLLVVAGDGPSLLGRDWLMKFRLNWKELFAVSARSEETLPSVLSRHEELFREELGTVKGIQVAIHVEPEARPRFCKVRPVPHAIRARLDRELERLQREDIIQPVEFAEWAAPVVPVVKRDGTVRLCGDYKLTVNRVAKVDSYPLPRVEDLFAQLSGGQTFTKLDLAHAYQQLVVDEPSRKYLTVNTHKGLFEYKRLPFGVASAPAIFQRTIETILQGLPHTCVYIDDILVTGSTEAEHLQNLDRVLSRLKSAGIRLKKQKCAFMQPYVEYLGHQISAEGLKPAAEKVRAIVDAPTPNDITQLKSFLGMLSYYSKFLPNMATRLAPLYALLRKQSEWQWGPVQAKAFQQAKDLLMSSDLLHHYDPEKPVVVSCDASPYGVGAVLSHRSEDGERPIAFASRSLSAPERRYSQLDKEALAIVFAVKRFHQYLFGRRFTILSDHRPLKYLLGETRGIPTLASARVQRWALLLSAYDYVIDYRPGSKHANADVLSRLPLPDEPATVPLPGELVCLVEMMQATSLSPELIRRGVDRDPLLSRVKENVRQGWKDTDDGEMRPFQNRKLELSLQDGCLLWGSRVIVPPSERERIVSLLHEGHPGIARMKARARGYVWWPSMDRQLEDRVRSCGKCQQQLKLPQSSPLHPWDWPDRPWVRLHADYAGPINGKLILVLVDSHSKWVEAWVVGSGTSTVTIEKLRSAFSRFGLPETLVTDNGSAFTSAEFAAFVRRNGIRHIRSAPYHPATNGLAERTVQVIKTALKKSGEGSLETRLSRILFHYRLTPHSTTGVSPAELLLGRRPRSHLDLIRPDLSSRVQKSVERQKRGHDGRTRSRMFGEGDPVLLRNFTNGPVWLRGVIHRVRGPLTFDVRLSNGRIMRRHIEHLRQRADGPIGGNDQPPLGDDDCGFDLPLPSFGSEPTPAASPVAPPVPRPIPAAAASRSPVVPIRRSSRIRHQPDRFGH